MRSARGVAVLTVAMLALASLGGCAPERPWADEITPVVRDAVEAVPGVDGAIVRVYQAGLSGQGLAMDVYITDSTRLTDVVDGVLEAAWSTSPIDPYGISLTAYEGAMPSGATSATGERLDLVAVAEELGFRDLDGGSAVDPTWMTLRVRGVLLAERYGARAEDADD